MIYFVGAGPGAIDLITVKGCELLKKADIIIYAGSLVNPELLSYKKEDCKIYDSASLTLEEVIDIMLCSEKMGLLTIRLHTGDPSLYGAIREQIDILKQHEINYEVVPGVSSFCAAAAALNAEYTLPDVSQSLIITRLAGRTPVPEKEEISLLASHGTSMVVFLSTGILKELTSRLLAGGFKEDTPAAIVYKASWPDEKIIRCTVSSLSESAEKYNITKTALILAGDFLGNEYSRSKLYDPSFSTGFRPAKKGDYTL